MVYDVTILTVRPATVPKALANMESALTSAGELLACWYTDIGSLNQIMVIREFESSAKAAEAREAAVMSADPLGAGEFTMSATSDTYALMSFLPPLQPGTYGPFFEARTYLLKPGVPAGNTERWQKALPARQQRSPVLGAMYSVSGTVPLFMHIWPYKSMDERHSVRTAAVKDGIWPPPGGGENTLLMQKNDIYVPAAFSPIK